MEGETPGGRAFRFDYCCWRGRRLSIAAAGRGDAGQAGVLLCFALSIVWNAYLYLLVNRNSIKFKILAITSSLIIDIMIVSLITTG